MTEEREDWDTHFMGHANQAAKRGTCLRKKVGAVFVQDHGIVVTGYNGSPRKQPHCTDHDVGCEMEDGHCVRTVHAEANGICFAARKGIALEGSTVYTTASPCYLCAKALIAVGIARVVFGEHYRSDPRCERLFHSAGVEVVFLGVAKEGAA